jgi:hypothetical protein
MGQIQAALDVEDPNGQGSLYLPLSQREDGQERESRC